MTRWYYLGVNEKEKRMKITDDRDCLSPDLTYFGHTKGIPGVKKVAEIEAQGVKLCIDTALFLYETGE